MTTATTQTDTLKADIIMAKGDNIENLGDRMAQECQFSYDMPEDSNNQWVATLRTEVLEVDITALVDTFDAVDSSMPTTLRVKGYVPCGPIDDPHERDVIPVYFNAVAFGFKRRNVDGKGRTVLCYWLEQEES